MKLIDKTAVVAEIERLDNYWHLSKNASGQAFVESLLSFLNTLEVKEMEEYKQPEYSCSVYQCGKKPHWNVGDTLAYYEFYSDMEGECVLGKVTKVEFNEEQCDWLYTFEDGSVYDEQSLLEDQTCKKN